MATATLLTDRTPVSFTDEPPPSARITFVPQRTYHTVSSDPSGITLSFPETKQLTKDAEDIAYELDKKNKQTDRFIEKIGNHMSELDHPRKNPDQNHVTDTSAFKKNVPINEETTPIPSPKQSVQFERNHVRTPSVIEVPIQNEEQLLDVVRKSMERLDSINEVGNGNSSLRRRSNTASAHSNGSSNGREVDGSKRPKVYGYEMTTSSYELRKKQQGTEKVVSSCSCCSLL